MKVAVLWARFGPYHLARLRGAVDAAREASDEVLGVQVAGRDSIYDWEAVDTDGLQTVTLFANSDYESVPRGSLRKRLTETLDDEDCRVVAVNGWGVPEARAAIAWRQRSSGRRAVLMSETARDNRCRRWWKEWLKRRLVSRCDAALAGGRNQVDYLRELGFRGDRIFTGYDAVDNAYFEDGSDAARKKAVELRREYGLPDSYFLACTRFLERKNVDGLLRAYDRYRRRARDPWGLVLLGSGEEKQRLRQTENELGLKGVVWPGFVQYESLPVYYGLASAFVHPAWTEAWGLVVNEAAASGLPVLLSRYVGAGHELLRANVNGMSFDPADIEQMANTMEKTAAMDDEARRRMGAESRRIAEEWSPLNFGRQLMKAAHLAASLPDR